MSGAFGWSARGVSARALLVAAASAVVGFAVAVALVQLQRSRDRSAIVRSLREAASDERLAACERAPASFSVALPEGLVAFPYDGSNRSRSNVLAPAVFSAKDRLPTELGQVKRFHRDDSRGPTIALRTRQSGPCAILAVSWRLRAGGDPLLVAAVVLGATTLAMTALGFLVVVQPFVRRMEAVRRAAESVGLDRYERALPDPAADDLSRLHRALDRTHERIRSDSARLADRLHGLRDHLANVAHDLRTPLASLQAQVEEALDAPSGGAEQGARLQGALRDCVYLAGLTENLRLASQLEEGWDPAGRARADLTATVARVVDRLAYYARRRRIDMQHAVPDQPVMVGCDPFACEQVIGNLIENAVTHLHEGGRIAVILDQDDRGFDFRVVDNGDGVPPPDVERLGDRTFRTDRARARDPRGSGLGLAIARTICERCGWTIAFARAEEGGLQVAIRGDEVRS